MVHVVFINDSASEEIEKLDIVGSVRCVLGTDTGLGQTRHTSQVTKYRWRDWQTRHTFRADSTLL